MRVQIEQIGVWRSHDDEQLVPIAWGRVGEKEVFLVSLLPWEPESTLPPRNTPVAEGSAFQRETHDLWMHFDIPIALLSRDFVGEYDLASKVGLADGSAVELAPADGNWWDDWMDCPVREVDAFFQGVEWLLTRITDTVLEDIWPEWKRTDSGLWKDETELAAQAKRAMQACGVSAARAWVWGELDCDNPDLTLNIDTNSIAVMGLGSMLGTFRVVGDA